MCFRSCEELSDAPSPGRDRPDALPDVSGRSALRQGHQGRGAQAQDAALVHGHGLRRWANAPKLTGGDIQTLATWADTGAAEGDAILEGDAKPPPVDWPRGWTIQPDLIVKTPKPFHVPAKGAIEITSFTLPTGLTKDTWIASIEARPGNRRVVHHVAVSFRRRDASVKYGEPQAQVKLRDENGEPAPRLPRPQCRQADSSGLQYRAPDALHQHR